MCSSIILQTGRAQWHAGILPHPDSCQLCSHVQQPCPLVMCWVLDCVRPSATNLIAHTATGLNSVSLARYIQLHLHVTPCQPLIQPGHASADGSADNSKSVKKSRSTCSASLTITQPCPGFPAPSAPIAEPAPQLSPTQSFLLMHVFTESPSAHQGGCTLLCTLLWKKPKQPISLHAALLLLPHHKLPPAAATRQGARLQAPVKHRTATTQQQRLRHSYSQCGKTRYC